MELLALKVSAEVFVAVGMALALAHALEYPGKMQLDRSTYTAVQGIYHPAFSIGGGIGEGLGIILTFTLMMLTPNDSDQFNWIAAAFASVLAMQVVYWAVARPVSKFWARPTQLKSATHRFFGLSAATQSQAEKEYEKHWPALQQWWEISHIARAALGFIGTVTIAVGVAS
jgi:hypothetical protein